MTLPSLKKLLQDDRVAAVAARVEPHEGETSHWTQGDEGQMLISVVTHRGVPITAIMCGGPVWRIPAIGTEVIVGFNDGDFEGDAYLMTRYVANATDLDDTKALIEDEIILVRASGDVTIVTTGDGNITLDPQGSGVVKLGGTGQNPITDGALNGTAVDPYTGQMFYVLGAASSKVLVKK